MKTISGQFFQSFLKWKSIPEKADQNYAKASIFDRKLSAAVRRIVKRTTWDPLYDIHDEAQAKKKGVVNRIILLTMGDLKRAFLKWHHDT